MNVPIAAMFALALLGGCQTATQAPTAPIIPTVQYRSNPINTPGFVSTCAGGQVNMNYNCPEDRN